MSVDSCEHCLPFCDPILPATAGMVPYLLLLNFADIGSTYGGGFFLPDNKIILSEARLEAT